jgi:hypothetical protein
VVKSAMTKLAKNGKGILLMHDFQHATGEALPELLRQLKVGGYKIVHMVPKEPVTTLARYDEMSGRRISTRPATTHGPNRASSGPSASDGSPKKKIGIVAHFSTAPPLSAQSLKPPRL